MKKTTMYKQDNTGKIRIWTISQIDENQVCISHGVYQGALQNKIEDVPAGKGGRTLQQQIVSRMSSRISAQYDKGYVDSLEYAKTHKATNSLGLKMPMLAKPYDKSKPLPSHFYMQYKFDGNRCLITKLNGAVQAYSRKGKPIKSIDHILAAAKDIPEGMVLDGELYCHGVALQTLRSWIAAKQTESNNLVYMCYDIMEAEPYEKRLQTLQGLGLDHPIRPVETVLLGAAQAASGGVSEHLRLSRAKGYEGLILRTPEGKYEDGKRSKHLIKVKQWEDDEFTVISIEPSSDGWAILVCEAKNGGYFKVSCHGGIDYKTYVYQTREDFVGRKVTVEYANLTLEGLPFHPVALAWRDNHE